MEHNTAVEVKSTEGSDGTVYRVLEEKPLDVGDTENGEYHINHVTKGKVGFGPDKRTDELLGLLVERSVSGEITKLKEVRSLDAFLQYEMDEDAELIPCGDGYLDEKCNKLLGSFQGFPCWYSGSPSANGERFIFPSQGPVVVGSEAYLKGVKATLADWVLTGKVKLVVVVATSNEYIYGSSTRFMDGFNDDRLVVNKYNWGGYGQLRLREEDVYSDIFTLSLSEYANESPEQKAKRCRKEAYRKYRRENRRVFSTSVMWALDHMLRQFPFESVGYGIQVGRVPYGFLCNPSWRYLRNKGGQTSHKYPVFAWIEVIRKMHGGREPWITKAFLRRKKGKYYVDVKNALEKASLEVGAIIRNGNKPEKELARYLKRLMPLYGIKPAPAPVWVSSRRKSKKSRVRKKTTSDCAAGSHCPPQDQKQ